MSDQPATIQEDKILPSILGHTQKAVEKAIGAIPTKLITHEVGKVQAIGTGVAWVSGLPGVKSEELIHFQSGINGFAYNLDRLEVGVILLGKSAQVRSGQRAFRTSRVLDVPVGESLLGRVVDALGRPLDELGSIRTSKRLPIERRAPDLMERAPVEKPLQTGLKVIDALIPIGRGQRELILGDRQTGKTSIALDTILNQRGKNVICIYCAIGQRDSSIAKLIAVLRQSQAMKHSIVVVSGSKSAAGLQFVAPYAATSMAEYFMEKGRDVLIVYDDLTRHARAYRELSLLLRRPPGREAYPGDIFYIHSRLLERASHYRESLGGGSLTALPIIETQAQNISAYIPTNLVSITDGQIYLSPDRFQKGILPAVDVGKSVSRVGGKAQLPAYQAVSGDLRLSYSQFEELEVFSRFGTRLDELTQKQLKRGRRVREVLKQPENQPISVPEQIAVMIAVTEGFFDDLPIDKIPKVSHQIRESIRRGKSELRAKINRGSKLTDELKADFVEIVSSATNSSGENSGSGNS